MKARARNEVLADVVGLIWKLISDDEVRYALSGLQYQIIHIF